MSTYTSLRDLFQDIADAIRTKTLDASALTPSEFPDEILSITGGTDLSVVTAAAGDVKSGQKFVDSTGTTVTGTMPVRTPELISLAANGTYTIPAGYHSGNGVVSQTLTTKAATNHYATASQQTIISAGTYCSGAQVLKPISATNLTAGNIKSGVTVKINNGSTDIFEVEGSYSASSDYVFQEVTFTTSDPEYEMHTFGAYSAPTSVVGTTLPAYKVTLTSDAQMMMWEAPSYVGTANATFAMGYINDFSFKSSADQSGRGSGGAELQTASFCWRDANYQPNKKIVYIPAELVSGNTYKATFALKW